MQPLRRALFTLGVLALATPSCGPQSGVGTDGGDAGSSDARSVRPQRVYCSSSRHCAVFDQVCDARRNVCVDCVGDEDCPGDQRCILNHCATITLCASSRTCNGLVCDTSAGRCVECVSTDDCADGQRCSGNVCVAACNGGQGCPAARPVCEPETELCVECTGDEDCARDERCFERECLPRPPGDGGVAPADAALDAVVPPPDAVVEPDAAPPIDAVVPPADVFVPPADVFVPPPDVPVPPRDVPVDTADPCSDATTCGDCTRRAECGFCRETGVCSQGTSRGPNGGTCGTWSWVSTSCTPDAGPADTGLPDTGPTDTGPVDTGTTDTGATDAADAPDTDATDPTDATDTDATDAGDRCADLGVCQACSGGCGFCVDTGRCVAGDDAGPATGSCVNWNTRTLMCRDYDTTNRCLKCYPDADGDGFPGTTVAMCVTESACPAGTMRTRSDNKFDCADTDANAYPGQTNYFETPVMGTASSFDYNCDGIHGMRYPTSLVFCSAAGGRCTNNGWRNGGTIPPCGTSGTFGQCEGTACTPRESPRIQACR